MVTSKILCKFTTWFDVNTSTANPTVLGVTMDGEEIANRLYNFFLSFKYYKMVGVKLTMVPAASLPADPGHISIVAGANVTDPRDILNPGTFRVLNGEPFVLNPAVDDESYNYALADNRWKKF